MDSQILNSLLDEAVYIRWLLVAIVVLLGILLILFLGIVKSLHRRMEININENKFKNKELEIEQLLASGLTLEAKELVQEWLSKHPKHIQANWILAKAHYSLGELVDTKRVLQSLLVIAPHYQSSINIWLERIEKEIQSKGLKEVK